MSALMKRRAVLSALAAAPMTVVPAATVSTTTFDAEQWNQALARYEAARVADDRFYHDRLAPVQQHEPICRAFDAYEVGRGRDGKPVWHRFTRSELVDADSSYAWAKNRGWREAKTALASYEIEYANFDARTGIVALSRESDRLNNAFAEAEEALLLTPAPHLAAICKKLVISADRSGSFVYDNPDVVKALRSDAERLGV